MYIFGERLSVLNQGSKVYIPITASKSEEAAVEMPQGGLGRIGGPSADGSQNPPTDSQVGTLASVVRTFEFSKKPKVEFLRGEGTGCNFSVWSHDSHSYSNKSIPRVPPQRNGSKNKHA